MAKMITGKINLLNLKASIKKMSAKSGEIECLIIPIELNKLIKGEKGVYLDLIAFELANPKEGSKDTHLVKQSFSKEIREAMTEEEAKAQPIIGNLAVWGGASESAPVSSAEVQEEESDLPF